jgi:LmbE family N-acetylglucosaminyl deacetylase
MAGMAAVVAFHAHPDDEVLWTGGTLARLAADGHRVIVVVACSGGLGQGQHADPETRLAELRASAAALGVARVVHLGYADSGHGPLLFPDPPGQVRFARADLEQAAARLAALIAAEEATLLLSYDRHGGYGHRDHVRVHQVGAHAAELAAGSGRPLRVLEATLPRELVALALVPARALRLVTEPDAAAIRAGFTPRAAITHRQNVRRFAAAKQAALAAHGSQFSGRGGRLFRVLITLPVPVFGWLCGREWFAEAAPARLQAPVSRCRGLRRPAPRRPARSR